MKEKFLIGKVVDIDDPNKLCRIKCEILNRTDGISIESLPWYVPFNKDKDVFDLPKINEYVYIKLWNNDIHLGMWMNMEWDDRFKDSLSNEDYKSAKIILKRYLDDWETEGDDIGGILALYYTITDGFMMMLKDSKINIERDSSIHLFCRELNKQIHITKDQISLGQKNKSEQPATMGDDNNNQHEMEIDYIKWLYDTIAESYGKLSSTASANPYTAPLSPIFTEYQNKIKQEGNNTEQKCKDHLPETLSELVSLDKTIE